MKTVKQDGIVELMQLMDYIAPKFKITRLPGGKSETPTTPATVKDFGKVFQRHYEQYVKDYPGTTPDQYRRHAIQWLTDKIDVIKRDAPTARHSETVKWAEIYIDDYLKATPQDYGIASILNPDQLALLYEKLEGSSVDARQSDFIAALSGEPLPPGFKPVKWLLSKVSLRAFIHVMKDGQTVKAEDAKRFVDKSGRQIELSKPKKDKSHDDHTEKYKRLISRL